MQKLTQWRLRLAKTLYREFQHLWEFGRNIPLAFRNGCDDHRRRSALLTGYPVELLESDGKYRGACVRYRLPDTCYYPVSCLQWKTFVLIEMASIRMILEQIANILTCFLHISGTWKNSTSQNPMGISLIWPERWSWACFEMVIRRKWGALKMVFGSHESYSGTREQNSRRLGIKGRVLWGRESDEMMKCLQFNMILQYFQLQLLLNSLNTYSFRVHYRLDTFESRLVSPWKAEDVLSMMKANEFPIDDVVLQEAHHLDESHRIHGTIVYSPIHEWLNLFWFWWRGKYW